MYQDLLRCLSQVGHSKAIKLFDVIDWMLSHNYELIDFYSSEDKKHTPHDVRRTNRRNTIKLYLDNLVSLRLVASQLVKEERGDGNTTEYKLEDWGYVTALIMDIDKKGNNEDILNKIFQILQKNFANYTSSRDAFFSIFLRKCKEKDYFKNYVLYLKNLLHDPMVKNRSIFFRYFLFLPLDSDSETKALWKIWKDSFSDLTQHWKTLFTQYLKIQLEYIIDQKINAYSNFEQWRFDNSYTYVDELVIESKCDNCNIYFPLILNIITYLDMVISRDFQMLENKKCSVCKIGKLEITPELINFDN